MRSLSKMILMSAAVLVPILAAGCSDDEGSDNPGSSGSSTGGTNAGSGNGGDGPSAGGVGTQGGDGPTPVGGTDAGGDGPVGGSGGGPSVPECDLDALTDAGAIPVDGDGDISEDTTLESGNSYTLDAVVNVLDGVTLTIEPCVKILGTAPTAILGVLPGGTLNADGEAEAPIVFTSSKAAGERAPGDWGGIIILGNAQVNQVDPVIEGLETATGYGAADDAANAESSGILRYVRVEYVGRDIDGAGNESNGITFGGVGSGTVVSHVMVSNSIDDCFEFFGGAVNADHLIALNCDDDMFDTDFGYSGSVQFAFGRQFATSTEADSNGFEMDTANNESIDPRTTAKWANVTLCGANTGTAPASPRIGMVLRRQVSGSIENALVTGFDSGAFSVRNITGATPPTDIALTSSAIFENASVYHAATNDAAAATWFEDETTNEDLTTAPAGFDCYANPPQPVPDAAIEGEASSAGFEAAPYKGAFSDENWMTGAWVDWSEN